jgi:hypothetical protein
MARDLPLADFKRVPSDAVHRISTDGLLCAAPMNALLRNAGALAARCALSVL